MGSTLARLAIPAGGWWRRIVAVDRCVACFGDQREHTITGRGPVPARRRATWELRSGDESLVVCAGHRAEVQARQRQAVQRL